MGSGPYKARSSRCGDVVSYLRDPNYWGRDLDGQSRSLEL